jgi:hypothetical protein
MPSGLGFLVHRVLVAELAELHHLELARLGLFVLGDGVVAALAVLAGQ